MSKPGRNDPCHCGSGQKYKKCHLAADDEAAAKASAKAAAAKAAATAKEAGDADGAEDDKRVRAKGAPVPPQRNAPGSKPAQGPSRPAAAPRRSV